MSRKHSTLLKEDIDEDEGSSSGGEKKKREKDKLQDGGERRRKLKKGASDKYEGYYNNSMNNSSKVQPVMGAAVNPSADAVTSPLKSQPNIPPPLQPPHPHHTQRHQVHQQGQQSYVQSTVQNQQVYSMTAQQQQQPPQQLQKAPTHQTQITAAHWQQQQQQQQASSVRLLPPPGTTQHVAMTQQQYQASTQVPQAQYQVQAQSYQPHPPQGYYPPVQYPHGVPPQVAGGQGVIYVHHPGHPQHVLGRSQSLPEEPVPPQGWVPVAAPVSPTGQQQPQEQPVWTGQQQLLQQQPSQPLPQENLDGNWVATGHGAVPPQGWSPAPPATTNAKPREGQWAAFSGSPPAEVPPQPEEQDHWVDTLDHSSSDEDIDRSSSPELCGEEGEGLLRAPSLTSFAESTSSVEEESEEDVWLIQAEQEEYYTKQFKRLQPAEDGVIKGPKARDFFIKSNLPTEMLSRIWHLSDINKDNALDLKEFCIAMHLVVAIRHGLDLPLVLPPTLLNFKHKGEQGEDPFNVAMAVGPTSPRQENSVQQHTETRDNATEDHSTTQPTGIPDARDDHQKPDLTRPRSFSDPSNPDEPHDAARKISMPASVTSATEGSPQPTPLSPGPHIGIERPRAMAKVSLLDSAPGQLLPPPSGKFASKRLSPISDSESDSDEASSDTTSPATSPVEKSPPKAMPYEAKPVSPSPESAAAELLPTPPGSPRPSTPEEPKPQAEVAEKVVLRQINKRSGERPRSAGDVNQIKPLSDSSPGSTPSSGSQGSHDGKKEPPPPPPPRNKKGHSRSSSLDLNKLFAAKAKEAKEGRAMSASSASSSQSSQNSETTLPIRTEASHKEEPEKKATQEKTKRTMKGTTHPTDEEEEENFADFSRFDSFVQAQGSRSATQASVGSSAGRSHRRSHSLDQDLENVPSPPRKNTVEGVLTSSRANQEALPRPVPKMKPASPPPVKLTIRRTERNSEKDKEKERKLNTEPPKVVVKPLTKEIKLQNNIRELKDKNLSLSRLNGELQQELKEAMETRIALELKLERLKPFKSK